MTTPMTLDAASYAVADLTVTGGAAFDPNTIAGLVAWFDASNAGSITASGSPLKVSQWNNLKTSSTAHAVQAVGASQPTTGTRTQNSKNVLDFQGTQNMAVNPLANTSDNQTIFGVVLSDVATGGNPGWFSAMGSGNDYDSPASWTCHGTGTGFLTYNNSSNRYANATTTTAAHVVSALYVSGGQCTLYVDGSTAGGTHTANGTAGLETTSLAVGSRFYGSAFQAWWDGWIAEIIYYNTALGTTDRQSVEAYLKTKWGTP